MHASCRLRRAQYISEIMAININYRKHIELMDILAMKLTPNSYNFITFFHRHSYPFHILFRKEQYQQINLINK